jgi:hypothetical protein
MRAQRDPSSRAARRLQRDRRGTQSLTLCRASLSLRSRGPLEQQQCVDDCACLGFERSCGSGRVAVFGQSLCHGKEPFRCGASRRSAGLTAAFRPREVVAKLFDARRELRARLCADVRRRQSFGASVVRNLTHFRGARTKIAELDVQRVGRRSA